MGVGLEVQFQHPHRSLDAFEASLDHVGNVSGENKTYYLNRQKRYQYQCLKLSKNSKSFHSLRTPSPWKCYFSGESEITEPFFGVNPIFPLPLTTSYDELGLEKTSPISGLEFKAPLQMIRFQAKQRSFYAVIDGGSQINMMDVQFQEEFESDSIDVPFTSIGGIGSEAQIMDWRQINIQLPELFLPSKFRFPVALLKELSCEILFGMPFLKLLGCQQDYIKKELHTKYGILKLYDYRKHPNLELHPYLGYSAELLDENILKLREEISPRMDMNHLALDQREYFFDLLTHYQQLWKNKIRGRIHATSHAIYLKHYHPIVSRPRYCSETKREVVRQEVESMLKEGLIRHSKSPYSSEIVLVLKPTGEWRFCVDYRPLNEATISDNYPLPLIRDLLAAVKNSQYFVALDLRSGYWQIPMEENSAQFTAFRCFLGVFEFVIMPFGLTNAPATFQRCMDFIFHDIRDRGILVYLDDILIHTQTFRELMELTNEVFKRLHHYNLTINLEKSQFGFRRLRYLGQIIADGKMYPDTKRVDVLRRLKNPTNITELRGLIGMIGYFQRYIPNYAEVAQPLYSLLPRKRTSSKENKHIPVIWSESLEAVRLKVLNLLADAVLAIPLEGDDFVIETDASGIKLAAVLSVVRKQEFVPVEFYSKTFGKAEQHWPAREKEAFAIVAALQKFDRFVRGRKIRIFSDNQSLKWLLTDSKTKVARWALILAEYNFEVFHKKGSEIVHIDYLTRTEGEPPDPVDDKMFAFSATFLSQPSYRSRLESFIAWWDLTKLISMEDVIKAQTKLTCPREKGYFVIDGIIYYHNKVFVPPELRMDIIYNCHSLFPCQHYGEKKTCTRVLRSFNWPNATADVHLYIQRCLICQRGLTSPNFQKKLSRMHPISDAFETVYMDFWHCIYKGYNIQLLTLIDQFTKWVECIRLPKNNATNIAASLLYNWIFHHGVPKLMVSDNAATFCNQTIAQFTNRLGMNVLTAAPYHPEGNAPIEAFHRTLNRGLKNFTYSPLSFDEILKLINLAYLVTPHTSTGYSPFFLVTGKDPRLTPDIDWRFEKRMEWRDRLRFLSLIRMEVQLRYHLLSQQLEEKKQSQIRQGRDLPQFEEGQLVLIQLSPNEMQRYTVGTWKCIPKWTVPHRVIHVLPNKDSAYVRCLITNRYRRVHRHNCRFIELPLNQAQADEWNLVLEYEFNSFYNPGVIPKLLSTYFQPLSLPQFAPLVKSLKPKEILPLDDQPDEEDQFDIVIDEDQSSNNSDLSEEFEKISFDPGTKEISHSKSSFSSSSKRRKKST